jgi:hypothetical protein
VLAERSCEFADLLRRLLPVFVVVPVQALDTPQVRPRARVTLSLRAWAAEGEAAPEASAELDLFEPPAHVRHLPACLAAKRARPNASLNDLEVELGVNRMTVKRALDYARPPPSAGLTEPYRVLSERPTAASRWRKRAPEPRGDGSAEHPG